MLLSEGGGGKRVPRGQKGSMSWGSVQMAGPYFWLEMMVERGHSGKCTFLLHLNRQTFGPTQTLWSRKKKNSPSPHCCCHDIPFFPKTVRRLDPPSLLALGALPIDWMLRSGKFQAHFQLAASSFPGQTKEANDYNNNVSHMLPAWMGTQRNSGPTQPVRLGIRLRMSNRYSLSHWKLSTRMCLVSA